MLKFFVIFLFGGYMLTHMGQFGFYSGRFSPFLLFMGLLFLFAILRRRDRQSNPPGRRYGQRGPSAPGNPQAPRYENPQGPVQGPGGSASPYTNYGSPGNVGEW